jgi:hypothetical protein
MEEIQMHLNRRNDLFLVSGDLLPHKFTMTGGGEVHINQSIPISLCN